MSKLSRSNYIVHTLLRARDWQDRPQYDQVCHWWRDGGQGVCALVGMGGAGKTAIADRFLNDLLDDTSTTRQRVNPPQTAFVYSFYDDDKPKNFFRHLQFWLEGTSAPNKQKSPTQLMFDIQQHQGLIILDGLEKVQESGARGGFGRLTSPSLRDLLNHIACGSARELSVLVTSRFPLTDLRDSQPRFFRTIAVDQIDVAAGVVLLRDRGVRGTDVQLAAIVEHCGRHVLTIDLAGGYIKEYGNGDPATPLNLGTVEELQAEAELEPDDDKRAVLKQGIRFARIAQRYREAMQSSDEAALALLERICLFRLGVDCETLTVIFTGPSAEKVSGKALASLDADQLQKKLDWLTRMRIVQKSEPSWLKGNSSKANTKYGIHPAVQDGFLSGFARRNREDAHEAVLKGLKVSLGDIPGENPSDPATLDLLEEMIFHTLSLPFRDLEAWDIYMKSMGGAINLSRHLGDNERGLRICQMFANYETPATARLPDLLVSHQQGIFLNEWAYYLKRLGQLDNAQSCYERAIDLHSGPSEMSIHYHNLADILMMKGRLTNGLEATHEAICAGGRHISPYNLHAAQVYQARGCMLCGDLGSATTHWNAAAVSEDYGEFVGPAGLLHTEFLIRVGKTEEAESLLKNNHSWCLNRFGSDHECKLEICAQLAEVSLLRADRLTAQHHLGEIAGVAISLAEMDARCWTAIVKARIELFEMHGDQSPQVLGRATQLTSAETAIAEGLKIARDCGYGLYHIDLLLERVRLHLLRGDAGAALDDIEVALDTGIPAIEETGQVELLAANHEECGYAWVIPAGLQLRAEALLLQAAREVIAVGWASPTEDGTLNPINVEAVSNAHPTIGQFIDDAKQLLHEALDRWHDLRDPEPTEDNNFVHPESGKEYNYKSEGTYRILIDLEGGILTQFPRALLESSQGKKDKHMDIVTDPTLHGDRLWSALHRAIRAVREDKRILTTKKPEWNQGLNIVEINELAMEAHLSRLPVFETGEIAQGGIQTDRSLKVNHPDIEDPVELVTWRRHGTPNVTDAQIDRLVAYLGAWQEKRRNQLTESQAVEALTPEDDISNRFNVALSFPGEHRDFVLQVAEALAANLTRDRVFYDEWYEVELLGTGGDLKLQSMYENSDLVVPFFSQHYDKPWCSMEWETIRGILLNRRKDDAVIPVHLDDTDVAGWSAVNFGIRLRGRTPQQIADLILQALAMRNPSMSPTSSANTSSLVSPSPVASAETARSGSPTGALAIWQEKLDYLQQQEAITADAAQKFAIKKQIEEAQQKIQELGGNP